MITADAMPHCTSQGTPQVLLAHHRKQLRLPTVRCEYDKVAREPSYRKPWLTPVFLGFSAAAPGPPRCDTGESRRSCSLDHLRCSSRLSAHFEVGLQHDIGDELGRVGQA